MIWNALWREIKIRSHNTSYYLIEVVTKAGLTVRLHKTSYYLIEVVTKAGLTNFKALLISGINFNYHSYSILNKTIFLSSGRGHSGSHRMVVGFTSTFAISAYHHWSCEFESHSGDVYLIQLFVIKFVSNSGNSGFFHQYN